MSNDMSNNESVLQDEGGRLSPPPHIPCVCIPYTNNTEWGLVKERFETAFGAKCVKRVDVIKKRNRRNKIYNCVFVHFTKWPDNSVAQGVRQKLMNGESIQLIYDFPWYWKCYASKNMRY